MLRSIITGSALALAGLAGAPAQAASPVPISEVRVVADPQALRGWGPNMAIVQSALAGELRRMLGAQYTGGRGGNRLIVEIQSLTLNAYAGSGNGRGRGGRGIGGGGDNDYLHSQATLVSPRGEVIETKSVLSAVPASGGGAWYDPRSEQRRLVGIGEHNGWWAKVLLFGR